VGVAGAVDQGLALVLGCAPAPSLAQQ